MRAGRSAPEALAQLVQADPGADTRQVAMVDAGGNVAARTGARCVAAAGDSADDQVTAQANMVADDSCWPAMVAQHVRLGGLAGRLLAALDAAENEGGDVRGRQSAAILIVAGEPTPRPWESVLLTSASTTIRTQSSR